MPPELRGGTAQGKTSVKQRMTLVLILSMIISEDRLGNVYPHVMTMKKKDNFSSEDFSLGVFRISYVNSSLHDKKAYNSL